VSSDDSLDWTPGITPQQIQNRVLERVDKGSIILFHNDTPHTAAILSDIISSLKNGGYSIVPVSSIIMRENYQIDHTGRQKRKE
jgi:peptidoglycan/xylan/chitin deacetylase (PgdA/CDA1 family)